MRNMFLMILGGLFITLTVASAEALELPGTTVQDAGNAQPVQVYILMGQSNMVGAGKVAGNEDGRLEHAVKQEGEYPYLLNDEGSWATRQDVRYVRVMGSGTGNMRTFNNEWMSIEGDGRIGPEFGIGWQVGEATDAPVLILKSCIGNRSLGWDLLPPGSKRFEFQESGKTMVYAGYKDSPSSWEKGTEPEKIGWYAGMQYDGDVRNAKTVLENLDEFFPGADGYEVAGFFWWQGDKDRYNAAHASRYEHNLVNLIHSLRKDFNAPHAKFVIATLGQTEKGAEGNEGKILDAMFAVSDPDQHPEFSGDVATVYTHPLSMGGASNGHYGGNAKTYMNVGEAMGKAMVELQKPQQ